MKANLEKYTMTDIVNAYTDNIAEEFGVSKKMAKDLFLNALVYNCVENEIFGQISYLMEEGDE